MKVPMVIFKGSGWASKETSSSVRRSFSLSPEGKLYEKLEKGSLTDKDIQTIVKEGDSKMMKALENKANEKKKLKAETEAKLGIDDSRCFDGVDNDGNLYKDIPLNKLEND
jgi:hypothetical protein